MREKDMPQKDERVKRRSATKLTADPAGKKADQGVEKKVVPPKNEGQENKKAVNGAGFSKKSPREEMIDKTQNTAPQDATHTEKKKGRVLRQITPYILFWIGLFALVSFAFDLFGKRSEIGALGSLFADLLTGLFGFCGYLFPFFLVMLALRWRSYIKRGILLRKVLLSTAFFLLLSGVVHVFLDSDPASIALSPGALYTTGMERTGGGLCGGFIGEWLGYFLSPVGACLIGLPILFLILVYLFDLTLGDLWQRINHGLQQASERRAARDEKKAVATAKKQAALREKAEKAAAAEAARAAEAPAVSEPAPTPAPSWRSPRPLDEAGKPAPTLHEDEPDSVSEPSSAEYPPERGEKKPSAAERRRKAADALYDDMQATSPAAPIPAAPPATTPDPTFTVHSYRDNTRPAPIPETPPVTEKLPVTEKQSIAEQQSAQAKGYYAPFALPVRPEPVRDRKEPTTSRIVITPHAVENRNAAEARSTPGFVTAEAFVADAQETDGVLDATRDLPPEEELFPTPVTADKGMIFFDEDEESGLYEAADGDAPIITPPAEPTVKSPRQITMPQKPTVIKTDIPADLTPEPVPVPRTYQLPLVTLLNEDKAPHGNFYAEMQEKKERLRQTLADFGLRIQENIECFHGPSITRYEFAPEAGVSVRSIQNRIDDISLSMGAHVRIEGLVMGKSSIGVEVPNSVRETVYMRTVLETDAFRNSKKPLEVPLGLDIGGSVQMCNLAAMPHLLIAGSTGSGKSVCINVMLISLLYKTSPADLRLILIDPKQVEFAPYEHIPHLYMPIITDMQRAAGALSCAVQEMERRFGLFKDIGVRDLDSYNDMVKNDPEREHLPRIIIVIDEFADLKMSCANNDPELFTCRIAQKARAAGIHLIIGTQRPSVDVITGKLKTNIASRIAFMVKQQVDSRTILDINGAETLTGKGDMLYMPSGAVTPTRVQGAFVSDAEVGRVVAYVRDHNDPVQYNQAFMDQIEVEMAKAAKSDKKGDDFDYGEGDDNEDPKFAEAVALAVETQKVATSLLQRRLGVGYGRAAKIIDRMEELGLVSAPDGNKARKILPAAQGYLNHLGLGDEDLRDDYTQ